MELMYYDLRINNYQINPKYLDGIEFNCHFKKNGPNVDKIIEIANRENLFITCGGDFHNDTPRSKCGTFFKDNNLSDTKALLDTIKSNRYNRYLIHENHDEKPYEIEVKIY